MSYDGGENAYENMRRIAYGESDDEFGKAQFIPVCPKCGRFVSADATIKFSQKYPSNVSEPNATCRRCGRVSMPFEGFM